MASAWSPNTSRIHREKSPRFRYPERVVRRVLHVGHELTQRAGATTPSPVCEHEGTSLGHWNIHILFAVPHVGRQALTDGELTELAPASSVIGSATACPTGICPSCLRQASRLTCVHEAQRRHSASTSCGLDSHVTIITSVAASSAAGNREAQYVTTV